MANTKIAEELVKIAKLLIAEKQSSETTRDRQRNRRERNRFDITYREIGFLDNPWREIFLRWFDGKGDWENAPFGKYLKDNKSLQRKLSVELDKIIGNFLKTGKMKLQTTTNFHVELDDNGYTNGYQLLHGTTKYNKTKTDHKQEFEREVLNDGAVIIRGKVHCVWHDIIDANRKYFGEYEFAEFIKKLSKAKDYKISIPFDFQFTWKLNINNKYEKHGYPWEHKK